MLGRDGGLRGGIEGDVEVNVFQGVGVAEITARNGRRMCVWQR